MTQPLTSETLSPPDLRIVPLDAIVPHEVEDPQRAGPLIRALPVDGVLHNPPVVTELRQSPGRLVVLDGTNRLTALKELGYACALVQVVPYELPHVELHTWNHVLDGLPADELPRRFSAIHGLSVIPQDPFHARAELARRAILAYCLLGDGRILSLAGGGTVLRERTRLLQDIVQIYLAGARLHRTNLSDFDSIHTLYPEMSAAIIFPKYEPVEILELAEEGLPVPPGITRHVIHGRALRLGYPLSELSADITLQQKNDRLAAWVRERFARKGVRYYAESTYLFDE